MMYLGIARVSMPYLAMAIGNSTEIMIGKMRGICIMLIAKMKGIVCLSSNSKVVEECDHFFN
jgi:Ca2+/Na+ antiporter